MTKPDEGSTATVLTLRADVDLSSPDIRRIALDTVEAGGIVLLLERGFELAPSQRELIRDTRALLTREPKKRNGRPTIVFDRRRNRMVDRATFVDGKLVFGQIRRHARPRLAAIMTQFGEWADEVVGRLFPTYQTALIPDRITYRPNERSSKQPLHIDSSYGSPTQGRAMFRVFCNVDPAARPRVWQVGESFESFVKRYMASMQARRPTRRSMMLARLGLRRPETEYDRMIADLRRLGKSDEQYQESAPRKVVEFPSGACWFAITDLVVHGALSGQHSLDQTYFLPARAMSDPARSSLRILERLSLRKLV